MKAVLFRVVDKETKKPTGYYGVTYYHDLHHMQYMIGEELDTLGRIQVKKIDGFSVCFSIYKLKLYDRGEEKVDNDYEGDDAFICVTSDATDTVKDYVQTIDLDERLSHAINDDKGWRDVKFPADSSQTIFENYRSLPVEEKALVIDRREAIYMGKSSPKAFH